MNKVMALFVVFFAGSVQAGIPVDGIWDAVQDQKSVGGVVITGDWDAVQDQKSVGGVVVSGEWDAVQDQKSVGGVVVTGNWDAVQIPNTVNKLDSKDLKNRSSQILDLNQGF
jgi:hypothetical protein